MNFRKTNIIKDKILPTVTPRWEAKIEPVMGQKVAATQKKENYRYQKNFRINIWFLQGSHYIYYIT